MPKTLLVLTLTSTATLLMADITRGQAVVEKAERTIVPTSVPGKPYRPDQFDAMRVTDTWKKYAGRLTWGKGQCLAILDDGCKIDIPQWRAKMPWGKKVIATYNSIDGNENPRPVPPGYHGTSIGYPSSLNHNGVLGVAFNNFVAHVRSISIVHLRKDESQTLAAGLQWVIDHHKKYQITAVNLSPVDDQRHQKPVPTAIDAKLKQLRKLGIWISAPCGNHHYTDGISWPACQPNCFAIGGTVPGKHVVHLDRFSNTDLLVAATATSSSNAYAAGCSMILREAIEKTGYDWKTDAATLPEAMMAIFQKTGRKILDPKTKIEFRELDLLASVNHVYDRKTETNVRSASKPIEIGSRRELFVDEFLIDKLTGNAELQMQRPIPREVAIVHDAPWEGTSSGYHTVFQDGDLYRMYYRGSHLEVSQGKLNSGRHAPFCCYAESSDGIHWKKPELGIVEFDGSKQNNIILQGRGTHNFTPFKDNHPDCAPDARYKALGGLKGEGGLFAFKSADGIHWSLMSDHPVITNGAFDSQNLAFWDSTTNQYRAYWRIFTAGVTTQKVWKPSDKRAIRTGTSKDFLHWGHDADLTYIDSPDEQLYTNQVKPYYRAPHILIGLPTRYIDRGWSESTRALPDRKNRELRASSVQRYGTAITEGLLMASRDGVRFKRWNEAFLRPGIGRPGTWQYGQQYIAWHIVETASSLPGAPHELSLYATENYWHGKGGTLRRYTLRLDGFVSIRASMKGGEFLSKPLTFSGSKLAMNFATSAAGSIRVEIQDAAGKPLEGFTLADCPDHFGDTVERVVTWKNGSDVSTLQGRPVRLRFQFNDADLYSLRFVE